MNQPFIYIVMGRSTQKIPPRHQLLMRPQLLMGSHPNSEPSWALVLLLFGAPGAMIRSMWRSSVAFIANIHLVTVATISMHPIHIPILTELIVVQNVTIDFPLVSIGYAWHCAIDIVQVPCWMNCYEGTEALPHIAGSLHQQQRSVCSAERPKASRGQRLHTASPLVMVK